MKTVRGDFSKSSFRPVLILFVSLRAVDHKSHVSRQTYNPREEGFETCFGLGDGRLGLSECGGSGLVVCSGVGRTGLFGVDPGVALQRLGPPGGSRRRPSVSPFRPDIWADQPQTMGLNPQIRQGDAPIS